VAVQVALCFVLVAACLMALRGLEAAVTMPLGFEPTSVTMAEFDLGLVGYSREAGETVRQRALEMINDLPGVQSAAYANSFPLNIDQSSTLVYPDNWPNSQRAEVPRAIKYQVSPGFFQTLGVRMLQGRDFDWRDDRTSRRVAVVNEAFARAVLRGREVVGRHIRYGPQGAPIEVIGVVETGKYQSLTEPETPVVFQPILQDYNTTTVMLVRSLRPTGEMAGAIRRILNSIDRTIPLFAVGSVEQALGFALLPMRVAAVALGAFGLLAVMLAATGIYGVVAYAVARRRREIAIRIAVGATRRRVLQLVFGRIATLLVVGGLLGLALARAAGGLLSSIVYQPRANDPGILAAVALIVGLVGVLACWIPARAALRIEPVTALAVE
jgi:predicted permease